MRDKNLTVLLHEMLIDLACRLRLADELCCAAVESLAAAAVLKEWESRDEALRRIGGYSRALRLIGRDLGRIVEGRNAVFPAELEAWTFESPDGDLAAQMHLKRLRAVAEGLELTVDRELLHIEFGHE